MASSIQSPARPPRTPITATCPPNVAAARAAFNPLPPGTATTSTGRWFAPTVRWLTSYKRSIDGFAAMKTIRGDVIPSITTAEKRANRRGGFLECRLTFHATDRPRRKGSAHRREPKAVSDAPAVEP